ncbi:MAG: hypothetical protein N4A63_08155 [Vallitalea sp.]|nr:hypothetical protein [Vallitalea sp.]
METNTLKLRFETIKNLNVVIDELKHEHGCLLISNERNLEEDYIEIKVVGKIIKVPYYCEVKGNMADDELEYKSLCVEEIKEKIVSSFDVKKTNS